MCKEFLSGNACGRKWERLGEPADLTPGAEGKEAEVTVP